MNLLHLVFVFNLVTAVMVLAGCFYLHLKYDERIDRDVDALPTGVNLAGIVGASLAFGLLSSVAVMFA